MINISMLDSHHSSPTHAYGDMTALAKRVDLYSGDDFYFGFASSHRTFLDIIGGHQPLAIKHGPTLSIYQHDTAGYTCLMYYIDVKNQALLPVISMMSKSSFEGNFNRLIPWSFVSFYPRYPHKPSADQDTTPGEESPEERICSVLETLAENDWPDNHLLSQLTMTIDELTSHESDLDIHCADLLELKTKMMIVPQKPSINTFVADYNPFYDNYKIDLDFIMDKNSEQITVRQVNDAYPRIEVIIPKPDGWEYCPVFKNKTPALFSTLHAALDQPHNMSHLLREHFPEEVEAYLATHFNTMSQTQLAATFADNKSN